MNDADILANLRAQHDDLTRKIQRLEADIDAIQRVDQLRQSFLKGAKPQAKTTATLLVQANAGKREGTLSDAVLAAVTMVPGAATPLSGLLDGVKEKGFNATPKAVYVAAMRWVERGFLIRTGKKGNLHFRREDAPPI